MLPALLALALAAGNPAPAAPANGLLQRYAGRVVVTASSTWPGSGPERLIDGDPATSWFSAKDDTAGAGKKPWIELRFPEAVQVKNVALLGNREPSWPKGFTIRYGVLELLDDKGAVLATIKNEGKN